jgi:hypothetical protein
MPSSDTKPATCSSKSHPALPTPPTESKKSSSSALPSRLAQRSNQTNGAVKVLCQTIKIVVSSAAEAEKGAVYMGGKHACPIRATLKELGHKQPATGSPFETDNSAAEGILNSKMRQKAFQVFPHALLVDERQ